MESKVGFVLPVTYLIKSRFVRELLSNEGTRLVKQYT